MAAFAAAHSANKMCRKPVKITGFTGAQRSGRGPGHDSVAYVFVFFGTVICRSYKLALSDQGQVTLQLKVRLSYLV
jgi:hypothetical protein